MNLLFHEHFSNIAASFPDHIALVDEQGCLSYQETDELSNGLASVLRKAGLAPSEAVAVFVSRQKEIMLGALAIIKAGGVFLPLDDAYPNDRLLYMMDDANVRFILADRAAFSERNCPLNGRQVYFFDEINASSDFCACSKTKDDPVMILYTSGTTGKPKGVIHRHALLQGVNDWLYNHNDLSLTDKSHMGIMSGFTFVATNVFMFGILFAGGTLHILPNEVKQNTDILYNYIKQNGITHIFTPSSLTAAMAEEYDTGGISFFSGGEKLRNFSPYSSDTRVYNMYGSTELATIFSIRVFGNETIIPIGYPTKGTVTLLVDDDLKPVNEGEIGELLVSDPRMSHSYLNLPEQTEKKWITIDDKLYFRTGDRMRRDEKGIYYILGRTDNMVKLRGFRIETGEVEAQAAKAFSSLGFDVGQIVVTLRTINGIDHLVCYYESPKSYDAKIISNEISGFLPSYMIPEIWQALDNMPRNANGKVIRNELPEPELQIHFLGAISSEAELRVLESTGQILNLEGAIDPDDSFIQLGGDSLRAMELSSILDAQGIKISGTRILSLQSIRDIANSAEIKYERLWTVDEYEAVKYAYLKHGEAVLRVLPLTARQDDLICQMLIHPDRPISDTRFMFIFESVLDEDILKKVLEQLSKRHPEMRTSIAHHDVSVLQGVVTDRRVPLETIQTDDTNIASAYALISQSEASKSFDMQFSPMFSVICIKRANEPSCLVINANKIIYEPAFLRMLISQMLELLLDYYPNDNEMRSWIALFNEASKIDIKNSDAKSTADVSLPDKNKPNEIFIYSDKPGKKIFFIHTGNTGSGAYYPLAQRLKGDYYFAVIEPYNLYHMSDARCGIENIAAKYIEILKKYQPNGPYILGGWCYGGVVAHEMACQLEANGERVEQLIMLDSHALTDSHMRELAAPMQATVKRSYFETCPLFKELRENGMLEAVIENASRVARDLNTHIPKHYHGYVTYFKPERTPAAAEGDVLKYWQEMMKLQAGNYENYCEKDKLEIILTPREHDEMMAPDSLDIIVPKLYQIFEKR